MINHIYSVVKARYIQPWMARNFEKTKYGRRIALLKDKHKGESCFIIGNGPSLRPNDLQILHKNNVISFGTNRVFKIFNQTDWRPMYYVSEDEIIIQNIQKEIEQIDSYKKFVPINLKWDEKVHINKADYYYRSYARFPNTYNLSMNLAHAVRGNCTVSITCLQFAIYMGFSEIYLLGVDHNFAKMFKKDGTEIIDSSIKNHFTDNYDKDIIDQGFQIDAATEAYMNVEKLSREYKTFRVYNATRGGKLEAFERVDFDSLFN